MMAWYVEFHDRVRLCRFPTERTEQTATPKGVRARSTACINGERLDSRLTCFQMQIALKIILKKWFFFIVQDLRKKNPWLMFPSFSLMDTWNAIQFWQFVQLRIVMLLPAAKPSRSRRGESPPSSSPPQEKSRKTQDRAKLIECKVVQYDTLWLLVKSADCLLSAVCLL